MRPNACALEDTVTIRAGALSLSRSRSRFGEQERRQVVDREGVFQAVGGHVPVRPEPADVVDQHIQPRVRVEHGRGQSADLGLRRQVGGERVHRRVSGFAG